jgi:hypothetical protein
MSPLILHPGPRLLRTISPNDAPQHEEDVTTRAVEFLFDRLVLGPDVRLRDLFGLFEHCPGLLAVYARFFARELCAEAALGPVPESEKFSLLHLELYQAWRYNSHERHYADVRRFGLHGVGDPPQDDAYTYVEEDGFVRYSLMGVPLRSMLDLPVHLATTVSLIESDSYSRRCELTIGRVHSNELTLGDMLQAVFWEMTWLGPPDDTEEAINEMVEISSTPGAWREWSQEAFAEEYFGDSYRRGCKALFESTGHYSAVALAEALRTIPDSLSARQWLNKTLGKHVKLRPAYRRLRGRELRQAFEQACEADPHSSA